MKRALVQTLVIILSPLVALGLLGLCLAVALAQGLGRKGSQAGKPVPPGRRDEIG